MSDLSNRIAIVTGGANGLGRNYVHGLHQAGAQVAVIDIDEQSGVALAAELGERCAFMRCDVTDRASVKEAFAAVMSSFGGLDVLINNAGTYPHQEFEKITDDEWHRVFKLDLDAVFYCTQEAVSLMKGAKRGKIINVATNVVWMLVPHMAHYIAAKSAVVGFTRATAHELGQHGITVNALAPGAYMPLDSEQTDDNLRRMQQIVSFQAIKRPQIPLDLVGAMLFLCSDDSDFMTGQVLCVDGGLAVV